MKIALITKYFGEPDGGSQRSMAELLEVAHKAGHDVLAIAETLPLHKTFPQVSVSNFGQVIEQLSAFTPDVVFTQLTWSTETVEVSRASSIPIFFFSRLGECILQADHVVFNSTYWCNRYPDLRGRASVLLPIIRARIARAPVRDSRDSLVMVNPIGIKGGHMLIPIAQALPQKLFRAVGGWVSPDIDGSTCIRRLISSIPP